MRNPRLTALLRQAHQENIVETFNEKICLIEDIMKAKRLLFGLGQMQHCEFLHPIAAVKLFDYLYDLNLTDLTATRDQYCADVTKIMQDKYKQLNHTTT